MRLVTDSLLKDRSFLFYQFMIGKFYAWAQRYEKGPAWTDGKTAHTEGKTYQITYGIIPIFSWDVSFIGHRVVQEYSLGDNIFLYEVVPSDSQDPGKGVY